MKSMKTMVPFTKDIALESKIAEITSISLEHEMHIDNETINGDFIISGDYKAHEISINQEPFCYRLPFSVELGENVDINSINFEIVDFNYQLLDEVLKVNIEFCVEAEERKEEPEFDELEDRIEALDVFEDVEETDTFEELITEPVPVMEEVEEERLDEDMQNTVLSNAVPSENNYHTYHVHIVKENESLEAICTNYDVGMDILKQYNNVDDILAGDKLLIPDELND